MVTISLPGFDVQGYQEGNEIEGEAEGYWAFTYVCTPAKLADAAQVREGIEPLFRECGTWKTVRKNPYILLSKPFYNLLKIVSLC